MRKEFIGMNEFDKLIDLCAGKEIKLRELRDRGETGKKTDKLEREIAELKERIDQLEQERVQREKQIKSLESKIPKQIKDSPRYKSIVSHYISQNTSPYIGDIRMDGDRLIFKLGGIPEIDDGKIIMQLKENGVYLYEEKREYDFETKKQLTHMEIKGEKVDSKKDTEEKTRIIVNRKGDQWSYAIQQKENQEYDWKPISDIHQFSISQVLEQYSISNTLGDFLTKNYIPIHENEEQIKDINSQEEPSNIEAGAVTVEDLRKKYTSINENPLYADGFIEAVDIDKDTNNSAKYLFFKKKDGTVIPIPELTEIVEGDFQESHYGFVARVV